RLAASSRSTAATASAKSRCAATERPTVELYRLYGSRQRVSRGRRTCIRAKYSLSTSDVCSGPMPRPFARPSLPAAYFPLGGPVPAADLVGREGYIRRATARLADGNHILIAG